MEKSVNVRLLFFAKARELAGRGECSESVRSEIVIEELVAGICARHNLNSIKSNFIIAVNGEYCDDPKATVALRAGDEVAVIPPISGG